MDRYYHELVITPSSYIELFEDFLIESTGEAIEEIDGSIVIRSEDELLWLVDSLHDFSGLLSERSGEKVSFLHSLEAKENRDWVELYRQSIHPIECSPFYIRPSWHNPKDDCIDILIDPALAFGSGHHGTTSACLKFIGDMKLDRKRILDVGCGSGILGIAALKLGGIVEVCDTDEFAVSEACKNASLNGVSFGNSWVGSIGEASGEYYLITANIVASILILLAPQLVSRLASGGFLVLSGILESYREDVLRKFSECTLVDEILQEEWVTLKLYKK